MLTEERVFKAGCKNFSFCKGSFETKEDSSECSEQQVGSGCGRLVNDGQVEKPHGFLSRCHSAAELSRSHWQEQTEHNYDQQDGQWQRMACLSLLGIRNLIQKTGRRARATEDFLSC